MKTPRDVAMIAFLALMVLALVLVVADLATGHSEAYEAEVIGTFYESARTDLVADIDADGNPRTYTQRRPARYMVAVSLNGRPLEIHTTRAWFYTLERGDAVDVCLWRGGVFGGAWRYRFCGPVRP